MCIRDSHNTGGKRNTLRYEWWIDAQDTSADDYTITGYKIYRYKVVEGHDTEETLVNDVTNYNQYIKDRKTALNELDDEHSLPAGIYRYKIVATFDTPDGDAEKTAYSNTVTIYEASVPVTMSVEQQMEGDNYTFNLEYKAEPVDEKLSMAFGDGTVADAMKYYVITVDEATATRLNNASKKSISFTQVTTESIYLSDATKLAAGTWYAKVEITDKDNAALNYVWSGITPNSNGTGALKRWNADKTALIDLSATDAATYSFTTYLVSADSDIAEWALLNFDAASDNTDIVAPAANLAINSVNVQKATRQFAHEHKDNLTHPSGARLSGFNDDGTLDADNPVIASPIKYLSLIHI